MEDKQNNQKENKWIKVFLIIVIILMILSFIVAGGGYWYYKQEAEKVEEQNQKALKETSETIEYGESISYENILEKLVAPTELAKETTYVIKINGQVLNPAESYKAESVGNLQVIVETCYSNLLFKNITNQKENIWKVEDTQKPIIEGVSNKEITQCDKFDAKDGITAKDNVDGNLEFVIEGDLDTNKVGKYTLTVKAVDKNGNETKKEFTVTVKQKEENKKTVIATNKKSNTKTTTSSSTKKSTTSTTTKTSSSSSTKNNSNTSQKSDPTSTKAGRLKLAKAEAKKVVSKIITSGMTKKEKAIAICLYITNTVAAQTNQSTEAYKTNYGDEAYAALILKIAACSGRCHAVTLLCNAAGLESKHINENKWTHQWNKVKIDDGSWLVIDPQIGYYGEHHPLE